MRRTIVLSAGVVLAALAAAAPAAASTSHCGQLHHNFGPPSYGEEYAIHVSAHNISCSTARSAIGRYLTTGHGACRVVGSRMTYFKGYSQSFDVVSCSGSGGHVTFWHLHLG